MVRGGPRAQKGAKLQLAELHRSPSSNPAWQQPAQFCVRFMQGENQSQCSGLRSRQVSSVFGRYHRAFEAIAVVIGGSAFHLCFLCRLCELDVAKGLGIGSYKGSRARAFSGAQAAEISPAPVKMLRHAYGSGNCFESHSRSFRNSPGVCHTRDDFTLLCDGAILPA